MVELVPEDREALATLLNMLASDALVVGANLGRQ